MIVPALLAGRRVFVTGGGRGLGAATVLTFASMGAVGVTIDLPGTAWSLPEGWTAIEADVSVDDELREAMDHGADLLGGINAVVAAAGVVPTWCSPGELDLDDFDRVLAVNVRGVASTFKHASRHLGTGASVVAVGSLNSWRGDPHIWSYVASKHAVLGLVRSAAAALGPQGIRVNCVAPGPVATDALLDRMAARAGVTSRSTDQALSEAAAQTALGRIATTDDVVNTLAFLTSDLAGAITGQCIAIDGGLL